MKKIYLLLLLCCIGNFVFATVGNLAISTPTAVATASVCAGTTDVPIYDFTLTQSVATVNLTGISFAQIGTAGVSGDIVQYHLWYGSVGNILIASSTTPSFSFSFFLGIPAFGYNFIITADIAATPTQGHTIIVNTMATTNITCNGTTSGAGTVIGGTQTILIAPAPITGNGQMCANGSNITLAETSIGGTWSGGTGGMATINVGTSLTGTVTPGATQGTTTFTYSNGCGSAASVTATVNATPAPISGNAQMCVGGSTIGLTNTSTNGTWSSGNSGVATVTGGSLAGTVTPGTIQGTPTISYSNGCGTAASITATVNALPAPIGGNAPLCANNSTITLTNTSTNGTWSGGTGGTATVNSNTGLVTSGLTAGTTTINYTNGCSPAATVTVTVNALPSIHTFTGGGAYCAGDTGVHIGLTLSDPGVSYRLYNGALPVGTAVAGTGGHIDFGLYSTIGLYHAIATNTVTLCTNYLTGVTVSINPLPTIFTITGGGSYCATGSGVHIRLDSSASGINYQLYNGSTPVGTARPGTGHPLDFGLQTGDGVYTVIASNAITFCPQAMAGSATVTIIPLPTADTITGGGGYCANDSGVHVGLNTSTAGIIYQLYKGSSPIGTPDTSAGGAIDFGFQTLGGVYTVIATDPVTTCSSLMTGSVTVTVNPLPDTFAITGGGSYCAGGTGVHIRLAGSHHGIRYQLYKGAAAAGSPLNGTGSILDFGLFTAAGVYKVVATDTTTHCMNAKHDSVIVTITPIAVTHMRINTGEGAGDTICAGSPVIFTAQTINGGATPSYQWNVENLNVGTNDSTYTYTPAPGDVLAVMMISSAACAVPDTLYDTMKIQIQTPVAPSVFILVSPITSIRSGQPDTLIAVATNCGYAPRYQWYKNGTAIAGATTTMYTSSTFANHDSISVRVLTNGACGGRVTDNSVIITVYPASVMQVTAGNDIKLIPNPNKGEFMVRGTLNSVNDEEVTVEITNMMGQVIYKNKIMAQSGVINERIQLSNTLANGMYILNLRSANENNVFRFVMEQ